MREAGIDVRDVPKFQCDDPSLEDHALVMVDKTIIPLSLIGVFSYLPTSRPMEEDLKTVSRTPGVGSMRPLVVWLLIQCSLAMPCSESCSVCMMQTPVTGPST